MDKILATMERAELTTLQVNMGNLCNQNCIHCHVGASPSGTRIMPKKVVDSIIYFLHAHQGLTLDITGGAPELNRNFGYFIKEASPLVKEIIVRSNLTVIHENDMAGLLELFKENNVHLICSLPCYLEENVDDIRGKGVFRKSIETIRNLNKIGYGNGGGLRLDLVYNPKGAILPPQQDELERDYKRRLGEDYGVDFNKLITITNVPLKRFKDELEKRGEYDKYLDLLKDNFNPVAAENVMCREFLSVGYDGRLYDCDFNQSLDWALKNKDGDYLTIDNIEPNDLLGRNVRLGEHCLSCTAGYGSSCKGALVNSPSKTKKSVKEYYGKVLTDTKDLKTSACCVADSPKGIKGALLKKIHPEIKNKFYGCGSPIPPLLEGCAIIDLGCGTGRDSYMAAALAGKNGRVIGIDMTDEQLDVAKKYLAYQAEAFGLTNKNIEFRKGEIEKLGEAGVGTETIDVAISNCVLNLSTDKRAAFKEVFRVLKTGGELYFSDVFSGRRVPDEVRTDPVLYGECLGGVLYIEDFRRLMRDIGCLDYRTVSSRRIDINDPKVKKMVGDVDFYSMTIRAFKLPDLEDICEDFGQIATYTGGIEEALDSFFLDNNHLFKKGIPVRVCGNTASMLGSTRYKKFFKIEGSRATHLGVFKKEENVCNALDAPPGGGKCC